MLTRAERYFSPSRLRLARQRRGLTKKVLAERLGVSPPMITYYEAGQEVPSELILALLPSALGFPRGFYFASDVEALKAEAVSFRARRDLTALLRDRVLTANEIASEIISPALRKRFRLPVPDVPDLAGRTPEEAARTVRDAWGLGEAPIPNLVHLLEAKGVEVYWLQEPSPHVDAVSYWKDGRPFVTLNLGKSGERGRMDAAHELGHLVLHRHRTIDGKDAEDEATRFASAFLLPPHAFRQDCPRLLSFSQLFGLKKCWGVSVAAMIVRAHELAIYSDWTYGRGFRDLSARGWRTNEPEPIERERSSLQAQAFDRLAQKGMTPTQWMAELFLPWEDIEELTPEATRLRQAAAPPHLGRGRPALRVVEGGLGASGASD